MKKIFLVFLIGIYFFGVVSSANYVQATIPFSPLNAEVSFFPFADEKEEIFTKEDYNKIKINEIKSEIDLNTPSKINLYSNTLFNSPFFHY